MTARDLVIDSRGGFSNQHIRRRHAVVGTVSRGRLLSWAVAYIVVIILLLTFVDNFFKNPGY